MYKSNESSFVLGQLLLTLASVCCSSTWNSSFNSNLDGEIDLRIADTMITMVGSSDTVDITCYATDIGSGLYTERSNSIWKIRDTSLISLDSMLVLSDTTKLENVTNLINLVEDSSVYFVLSVNAEINFPQFTDLGFPVLVRIRGGLVLDSGH